MAIPKKILQYLDSKKVKYKTIEHKVVYTAFDTAQTMKRKLNEIGKTLLIKTEKGFAMVIVPASHAVDMQKLKKVLKVKKINFVKEGVMKSLIKIKSGSITPFEKIQNIKKKGSEIIPVYVDSALLKVKKVIVGAGSFTESVEMSAKHLLAATQGIKATFAKKYSFKKPHAKKVHKKKGKTVKKKK